MNLLMIDNYDSFTYNLVHLLEAIEGVSVTVKRNDELTLSEVQTFDRIVLSPGPGIPREAGLLPEIVKTFAPTKRILGVCLGHQCIGEVFGGLLKTLREPVHGKATRIEVTDSVEPLFRGLPARFEVGRYHSWVVDRETFPSDELRITAIDEFGEIMALRHVRFDVSGVQFHPESILTPCGRAVLENFITYETRV
jgi:anthranilate synthase component 2